MEQAALAQVRIVLVSPLGPLNVGSVARVMKNMGLSQLVLVAPQCEHLGEQARQMALHAMEVLESAQVVESLPEALKGTQLAIATTARDRSLPRQLEEPRTALPSLVQAGSSALIFGPEDRGLSNDELKYAQRFIRIPSSDAYPSLNLAQAVGVCCYELYQNFYSSGQPKEHSYLPPLPIPSSAHAPADMMEEFYEQLESVLLKIGYLYPHTAAARMAKFRLLFNRSQLSVPEVAMLRGIFSQMEWFTSKQETVVGEDSLPLDGV